MNDNINPVEDGPYSVDLYINLGFTRDGNL